ncbi:MAG: sigma-54-dependent transcriptional regulator [Thermacetogeniaceae bacterium]
MQGRPQILVVDDEHEVGTFFRHLLKDKYDVKVVASGREVLEIIGNQFFDLILLDLKLSDSDGITLLRTIKEVHPRSEVIIMTGYSTIRTAVEAIQLGAFDYIEKPFEEIEPLEDLIKKALSQKKGYENTEETGFVVGRNCKMRALVATAKKIADKDLTVLIEGETGTGKEVLARYIHRMSKRAGYPFIAVNCAAFTETLLESELFGHEKGAFTGALYQRRGVFEIAHKGTLLLDELGEASLAMQAKLLRAIETREFRRVGGEKTYCFDVRIIATTNIDLRKAVAEGRFREDLFYRLNTVNLQIPPLRERKEDIPLLVEYVTYHRLNENSVRYSDEAMEILVNYPWPGNVRELVNVVTRTLALRDGSVILPHHLPEKLRVLSSAGQALGVAGKEPDLPEFLESYFRKYVEQWVPGKGRGIPEFLELFRDAQDRFVRNMIERALLFTKGDRQAAAKLLHLTSRQLRYYLNERKDK